MNEQNTRAAIALLDKMDLPTLPLPVLRVGFRKWLNIHSELAQDKLQMGTGMIKLLTNLVVIRLTMIEIELCLI